MFEEFVLSKADIYIVFFSVVFVVLTLTNRLPSVESIRRFISTIDDRGGNITVLALFSTGFFVAAMHLLYFAFAMIADHKLDEKSSVLMLGLTFVTGSAFGTAFGAMLKTMTGSLSVAPPSPTNISGTPLPDVARVTKQTTEVTETTNGRSAESAIAPTILPAQASDPKAPPAPPVPPNRPVGA